GRVNGARIADQVGCGLPTLTRFPAETLPRPDRHLRQQDGIARPARRQRRPPDASPAGSPANRAFHDGSRRSAARVPFASGSTFAYVPAPLRSGSPPLAGGRSAGQKAPRVESADKPEGASVARDPRRAARRAL